MDVTSATQSYAFTMASLKREAESEGQVVKQLTKDATSAPSTRSAPTGAAPAATAQRGQIVDLIT